MPSTRAGVRRIVCLALAFAFAAPAGGAENRSPRIASYTIEARLDGATHTVTGRETLHWRNDSGTPASELRFHLYLNAFANNRTTFLREMVISRGNRSLEDWGDGWGSIAIGSLHIGGEDLTSTLEAVFPDDPNPDDRTVVRLPLPVPLAAGESIDVEMTFTARLPKLLARTGYSGDFNFVAQWFPKIGVYRDGRWNCHQFHANSEFFADFGVYDVRLTVPANFTIGASGVKRDERDNGDGTKTVRYQADDVHDFAWTADPNMREQRASIDGVDVLLLCHERDCEERERFFGAVRHTLAWFGKHVGAYPYPVLTVVAPPPFANAAGGMEYPTLITALSPRWIPAFARLPEVVTVHELGHQFWYGLVASNEFEEAWLDEGVNSYTEGKIMDEAYGREAGILDLPSVKIGSRALRRGIFLSSGGRDPTTISAWEFLDSESYAASTYDKTALTLDSLEGYIGEDRVLAGLRLYFDRWRFRHPSGTDFRAAMNEAAGADLGWFFDQTLASASSLDYAVTRVQVAPIQPFAGIDVQAEQSAAEDTFRSTVVLERLGGVRLPVDVAVTFDDGAEMRERWDGESRWRRLEYEGTHGVTHAVVDPDGKLPLDIDPINNSHMRREGTRGLARIGLRWGFWFQNILHLLTSF